MTDAARHLSPFEGFVNDDARYQAIARRDKSADGAFVYAVTTTGVYCRPSCAARLAKPGNVRFYADGANARKDGFRACKRCVPDSHDPDERVGKAIKHACRMIDDMEETPSLDQLAAAAGFSPFHFHRLFKAATGVTPKAYAAARRAARVSNELTAGNTVTEAIYSGGFNTSSRFYETAKARLGMAPKVFREGGRGETISYAIVPCSLGRLIVAATSAGIAMIHFGDDDAALKAKLAARFNKAELSEGGEAFTELVQRTVELIEQPSSAIELPLDIRGTAFQQRVWSALRDIPCGETASYADVAARMGKPSATRAVARACATNDIAVAIPCHRVVRTDGGLGGYRWGMDRKRALLDREGA